MPLPPVRDRHWQALVVMGPGMGPLRQGLSVALRRRVRRESARLGGDGRAAIARVGVLA
jgi:hypothetical protein